MGGSPRAAAAGGPTGSSPIDELAVLAGDTMGEGAEVWEVWLLLVLPTGEEDADIALGAGTKRPPPDDCS